MEFGFGCLAFDISREYFGEFSEDYPFTPEHYTELVERALQSVPGITSLSVVPASAIDVGGGMVAKGVWSPVPHDEPGLRDNGELVIQLHGLHISFELVVPLSFQADREISRLPHPATTFLVEIFAVEHGPAALVWNMPSATERSIGPWAVRAVREYLDDEFARREDSVGPVNFEFLGPSPMHVDGVAEWATDSAEGPNSEEPQSATGWTCSWQDVRGGYADLSLELRGSGGVTEAAELVSRSLAEEAALFYRLVHIRNELQLREAKLVQTLDELINKTRKPWWRDLRQPPGLQELSLDALRLKSDVARASRMASLWIRSSLHGADVAALEPLLQRERGSIDEVLDPATLELVDLLEHRDAGRKERVTLVAAGFIGALAGSGLTALLT